MSLKSPFTRYRRAKTGDGQGGVETVREEGVVIYGVLETHQDRMVISGVHKFEDVRINDEIETQE